MSGNPTPAELQRRGRARHPLQVLLPPQLQRVNLNAAGIDIGAEEHWGAVPPGRAKW